MSDKETHVNAAAAAPTIDQVRELLFGSEQRNFENQIAALSKEIEQARAQLEQKISETEKSLRSSLDQVDAAHKARFAKTGQAIADVGRSISALSEK